MNPKPSRILAVDALRGLTVLGMVLCASIGFNSGLPAWMFHAQTPPPSYAFNPEIAGLTWVDLVFPFFLLPLGAAFPLAMRKKIENGTGTGTMLRNLLRRWAILVFFALILGNSYDIWSTARAGWCANLFMMAVWGGLFLFLVRVKNGIVNLCGMAVLAALAIWKVKWFGVGLDIYKSDIIMMILANVALFGGLIWLFTRNTPAIRWVIFGIVAIIKALDSYLPSVLDWVPDLNGIGWCFQMEWLQYLLIVIPGSFIGDYLLDRSRKNQQPVFDTKSTAAGLVAFAAVVFQLWGLQSRHVAIDLAVSVALAIAFVALMWKRNDSISIPGMLGFILMIAGIIFDPLDGGITKDYCNLSYLFTTGGMASMMIAFFIMIEGRWGIGCKVLVMTGQNPMIAYTVTQFLITPVLTITGAMGLITGLAEGSIFWGMMQGIILTGLMTAITCLFTKLGVFWRS